MQSSVMISTEPMDATFGEIIRSDAKAGLLDLDRDWLIDRFRQRGCLVFKGFRATIEEFEHVSNTLGRDFLNYQGGGLRWGTLDRRAINPERTVLTATGHTQSFPIPLHGEMYYMARPPEMIWFYCARASEQGGETTFADGRAIFEGLREFTRRLLSERRIQYIRVLVDGDWQVTFLTEDRGEVERVCRDNGTQVSWEPDGSLKTRYECSGLIDHPRWGRLFIGSILTVACGETAIRKGIVPGLASREGIAQFPMVVRLDDGEPIPEEAIEDMLEASKRVARGVNWEQGDFVAADNTWVLHGRRASPGTDRSIYVRMCACNFSI